MNVRAGTTFKRRLTGLVFGTIVGLAYGAVANLLNRALLPGVPLFQPPAGPLGNMLLCGLAGAGLGFVGSWPESSAVGALAAGGVAGAAVIFGNFIELKANATALAGMAVTAVFLWLPFAAMIVPFAAAVRWAANCWHEGWVDRLNRWQRMRPLVILCVLAGLVGLFSLHRTDARAAILDMNEMIRSALAGSSLPLPFVGADVGDFASLARGSYELEWTNSDMNRFRIPRPGKNFDYQSIVVARFRGGPALACLYVDTGVAGSCRGFPAGVPASTGAAP